MIIDDEELKTINGGNKYIVVGIAIGFISFIVGLIDGYIRPLSCNDW